MSHNVVADELLTLCCALIVDVINVCFQLIYLLLSNIQTQLHFSPCQSHPKTSPCGEFFIC